MNVFAQPGSVGTERCLEYKKMKMIKAWAMLAVDGILKCNHWHEGYWAILLWCCLSGCTNQYFSMGIVHFSIVTANNFSVLGVANDKEQIEISDFHVQTAISKQ